MISFKFFKEINYHLIEDYLQKNVIGKYINYDLEDEKELLYKDIIMHKHDPKYSEFIMEEDVGRDSVGNRVRPEDLVTYIAPGRRMLVTGKVLSCTPSGFQIKPDEPGRRDVQKLFREACYVVKYKKGN